MESVRMRRFFDLVFSSIQTESVNIRIQSDNVNILNRRTSNTDNFTPYEMQVCSFNHGARRHIFYQSAEKSDEHVIIKLI